MFQCIVAGFRFEEATTLKNSVKGLNPKPANPKLLNPKRTVHVKIH